MRTAKRSATAVALVTALLVVLGASNATAAEFTTEPEQAFVSGSNVLSTNLTLGGYVGTSCGTDRFSATLSHASGSLSAGNQIENCTSEVTLNGCNLTYGAGVETSAGVSQGVLDVGPAGCGPIKVASKSCTATIGSQTARGTVSYTTKGSGSGRYLEMKANVSTLSYATSGVCGVHSGGNGSYSGTWKVAATDAGGTPVGLFIATPPHAPLLEAAGFPTVLTAAQNAGAAHQFTAMAGTTKCTGATLSGEASAATSTLTLSGTYSGCTTLVLGATRSTTVKMNSCGYVFHVANAGPPYQGSVDVSCTKAGDAIEVAIAEANPCLIKVGPQQGLSSIAYANGEGSVIGTASITGISYVQVGMFCPENQFKNERSFTNGTYSGASTLTGSTGAVAITGQKQ
jgi:hypothetical protein